MLKIGIMGSTGYAGEELIRILLRHPEVKISVLSAKIERPQNIQGLFPWLSGRLDLPCEDLSPEKIEKNCDLVFLALPHKVSMEVAPIFLEANKKVIDLSADYRLRDPAVYEKSYNTKHKTSKYIKEAVYGLPEVYREKIKKARLIANPGCYPTGIILGCLPPLEKGLLESFIICDSKSGVSGAGRCPAPGLMLGELENSFKAYKVNVHQHASEIEQELNNFSKSPVNLVFVPHLVPMKRGILSTIYLRTKSKVSTEEALEIYRKFYKRESFIRILNKDILPDTKFVAHTNYCDIGIRAFPDIKILIVITAIDNLMKGASGQAVQNMNIMCGFEETLGLL